MLKKRGGKEELSDIGFGRNGESRCRSQRLVYAGPFISRCQRKRLFVIKLSKSSDARYGDGSCSLFGRQRSCDSYRYGLIECRLRLRAILGLK